MKGVLSNAELKQYTNTFNRADSEYAVNHVPNAKAFEWLNNNIPLFDCPDTTLEKVYYYRWWTFRKHLKQTPNGFVWTEFITPMNHGGKYNTISSALGHHLNEGRWLHDTSYINKYLSFWLYEDKATLKPHLHAFSSWLQHAVYELYLVQHDKSLIRNHLDELDKDYELWENEKQLPNGKFWQYDVRDAMEESISGSRKLKNVRPTINSYMYGNAIAMVKLAQEVGVDSLQRKYAAKAADLKAIVQDYLWDDTARFFKVRMENGSFSDAREAIGFIPWYFNLPDDKEKYAAQWEQLTDTAGFCAPWGLTTAERRHPLFRTHGSGHGCEWDGAVWPYATTQTLKALSNLLTNYRHQDGMNAGIFYDELHKYAWSHQKYNQLYIGEYQDEQTGEWLKGDNPRSSYYNHSGFADLIINDLVGLKPRNDNKVEITPLIPKDKWSWFCLDKVPYHGKMLTILYDETGKKYNKGKGFFILADGRQIHHNAGLEHVVAELK